MSETAPVIEVEPPLATEAKLATELAAMKDRHLRLQAEFENFRKRKMKEAEEVRQFAAVNVIEELLPVLDHLDLALDANHDRTDPKWGAGIDIIAKQFVESLKVFGLDPIVIARGDKFEHTLHEAVAEEETSDVPAGHITTPVRKGYRVRDRIIRHAQAIVARAKTAEPPSNGEQSGSSEENAPT